jgi:hypothetical protein
MKKLLSLKKACILAFVTLVSCAPQSKLLQPTGDRATVAIRNRVTFLGELLAVSDSTVLFKIESAIASALPQEKIISVRVDDLQSITIAGYSNKSWVTPLVAFEVVPALLLTAAASSAEAEAGSVLLIFSIPPALTYIAFATSTPRAPKFEHPFTPAQLESLKKFARFPQGLTLAQLEQLLVANQQSKIRQFK